VAEFAEYRPVPENLARSIVPFYDEIMKEIEKLEIAEK
jgi:hypothetical protein